MAPEYHEPGTAESVTQSIFYLEYARVPAGHALAFLYSYDRLYRRDRI